MFIVYLVSTYHSIYLSIKLTCKLLKTYFAVLVIQKTMCVQIIYRVETSNCRDL